MTSTYKLTCPDCGHDASDHGAFDACPRTAASLYAAECERLSEELRDEENDHAYTVSEAKSVARESDLYLAERDAARAECERLRAVLQNARRRIEDDVQGEIIVQHDCWRHGYPSRKAKELANHWADGLYRGLEIARAALDAGEPLPNVGTPADVPADGNGGAFDTRNQSFAADILRYVEGR